MTLNRMNHSILFTRIFFLRKLHKILDVEWNEKKFVDKLTENDNFKKKEKKTWIYEKKNNQKTNKK